MLVFFPNYISILQILKIYKKLVYMKHCLMNPSCNRTLAITKFSIDPNQTRISKRHLHLFIKNFKMFYSKFTQMWTQIPFITYLMFLKWFYSITNYKKPFFCRLSKIIRMLRAMSFEWFDLEISWTHHL